MKPLICDGSSAMKTATPKIARLDWNGHGEFLSNAMSNFFRSGYQVDTSVTFRGERLIGVHRLLMSAFLPTFKRAVDAGVAGGPLTELNFDCVAGSVEDITALLEFIYTGRTTVLDDRLDRLGRLAEDLCFDGLSEAIADHLKLGGASDEQNEDDDVVAVTIKEEPRDDPICLSEPENDAVDEPQQVNLKIEACEDDEGDEEVDKEPEMQEEDEGEKEEEEDEESAEGSCPDRSMTTVIPEDVCSVMIKADETPPPPQLQSQAAVRANGNLPCVLCNMFFLTKDDLRIHMKCSHPNEKLYVCKICDFRTTTQVILYRHVERAHPMLGVTPPQSLLLPISRLRPAGPAVSVPMPAQIPVPTNNVIAYRNSMLNSVTEAASGKFPCNQCIKVFTLPSALLRHVAEEHKAERQVRCAKCSQTFTNRYWLALHVKNKHMDKGSSSSSTSTSTSTSSGRSGRIGHSPSELAMTEGNLRCELCSMKFDTKMDMKIHFRCSHPANKLYECKRCDFVAVSEHRMERHRRRYVHNSRAAAASVSAAVAANRFTCTVCGKEMTMSSSLQRHMARAHCGNPKRFHCKACALSFATRFGLMRHMSLKHSDDDDDMGDRDGDGDGDGEEDEDHGQPTKSRVRKRRTTRDTLPDGERSNGAPT